MGSDGNRFAVRPGPMTGNRSFGALPRALGSYIFHAA